MQADAGGSPSLVARGLATAQAAAAAAEQIQIQVPNEKVYILSLFSFSYTGLFNCASFKLNFVGLGWFNHREGRGDH